MAYLLTHFWPGGTAEQYQVTLDAVTKAAGGKRPELCHAGGTTRRRDLHLSDLRVEGSVRAFRRPNAHAACYPSRAGS